MNEIVSNLPCLSTSRSDLDRSIWYHGYLMTVIARQQDTGGQFSIVETLGRRDYSLLPPQHVHHAEEESFYLLEGNATFFIDGTAVEAGPGSFVVLPRDIPHWFSIDSEEVRWLNIISPGGFEQFFEELGEPAGSLQLPPRPEGELDIPRLLSVAQRYDCEILPPS